MNWLRNTPCLLHPNRLFPPPGGRFAGPWAFQRSREVPKAKRTFLGDRRPWRDWKGLLKTVITRGIIENTYVNIQLVWLEFFVIWQGYCVWFFGQPWEIKWWTKNEDRFSRAMLDNQKMWHWLNVIDPPKRSSFSDRTRVHLHFLRKKHRQHRRFSKELSCFAGEPIRIPSCWFRSSSKNTNTWCEPSESSLFPDSDLKGQLSASILEGVHGWCVMWSARE